MAWLAFGVLGRLAIWTIQPAALLNPFFSKSAKLRELRECDFCLGFWVFTGLAFALGLNLTDPIHIPVLSEALTGLAASFLSHLARLGWESKFGVGIVNLGEFNDDP